MSSTSFDSLPLQDSLKKNLNELSFTEMTPIQAESLPHIFANKDVTGLAKTGSGKTLAFGLKLLNDLDSSNLKPQGLILCPTRELAEQVASELRTIARMQKNVKVLTICGGVAEFHQEKSLQYGAHIIVGTPGRVLRLLNKDLLNLDSAKTLILDEADRMLDMGFLEDIESIEQFIPRDRQTLLFSATFPDEIKELSSDFQKDPEFISVDTSHDLGAIDQIFYEVESHKAKDEALLKVLNHYRADRFIVFCKTKQLVDHVTKFLNKNGVVSLGIHGDHEQRDRTKSLEKFSNHSLSALVATDVAARGLDIKDLPLVINYDLTSEAEVYIHRIGRTGRAGKKGISISLFIEKNRDKLDSIEDIIGSECRIEDLARLNQEQPYDLKPPMKTIFISGGKRDKLRPGDIVGGIVGVCGIDSKSIGDIKILKILTYVAIREDLVDMVIDKLSEGKIKKRSFRIGLA